MFVPTLGSWQSGPRLIPSGTRARLWAAARRVRPAIPHGLAERSCVSIPGVPRRVRRKEWSLMVSPFGLLQARLPCDITVRPLDPYQYPNADRVLVRVNGVEGGDLDLDSILVRYDEALKHMAILSETIDHHASVEVKVPLKFDLNIKTSGTGCVKVKEFECDDCRIETEQGISIVQSVKTVNINKLQGSSVNISTEDGLLKAECLYSESSSLSSAAGDITLGSIHGDLTVHSKMGNITIDSLNGHLNASTHQGAIDVYVSKMGNVDLKSQKGSVTVKVPSSLQAHLQLSGSKVDVNPKITLQEMTEVSQNNGITINGLMNQTSENEKWIKAKAPNGTVHLKSQSWFQSLRLKGS
ncbi:protein FAM185A isoform X3 [Monodelphis domestica]|uniref:protein FAM185A isoform X3 n=1 Tax=Monodelphis domestica TaxID=13616 RepID=UPI0024E1CB91|nr:protein FAM185A isoform X3 [Monodelphis domestica]